MRSLIVLSAFVLGALFPSILWAADGVLLVQSLNDGASTTAMSRQVQMEPNRIRTELYDGDGRRQLVIFDGAADVLYIVDPARRTYVRVTRTDAAQMSSMAPGAMAMLQRMDGVSPAQRALLEQQLAGMNSGGATAVARPEYRPNGTGKVGERACDRYDGFTAGSKTSEICTVAPEALGLAATDFGVISRLGDFVRTVLPQVADQIVGVGTPEQGYSGVPVRTATTDPRNGRTITMQLTDARRATFEDSTFAVPAGFQQQSLLQAILGQ